MFVLIDLVVLNWKPESNHISAFIYKGYSLNKYIAVKAKINNNLNTKQ